MRIVHQNSLHQKAACTLQEQIFMGALASGSFIDEVKALLRSQHSGLTA